MYWDIISDIIIGAALAILGVFVVYGFIQLTTRKSLKKVDRPLLAFIPPLVLMVIVYVVFEYFIILNTRPNGSGEPSFPSTHVMIAATIFFITALAIPHYLKIKYTCIIIDVIMLILLVLISAGRILSNMHWPTDVVGGLIFAAIFAGVYYLITKPHKKPETTKKETK